MFHTGTVCYGTGRGPYTAFAHPLPVRYAIPRYLHSAQLTDREVQAEQEAIEPSSAEASPPENTRAAAGGGGGGGGGERASERVCPMALMYTRPPCESHGVCI